MIIKNKIYFLLFFFSCLILLIGCQSNDNVNVKIQADIEKYSLFMSSVPGFPFTAQIEISNTGNKEYKYLWSTNYGRILTWEVSSGKIEELTEDVIVENNKIYWAPILDKANATSNIEISVEVVTENGIVIATDKIELAMDENLYVTVKK